MKNVLLRFPFLKNYSHCFDHGFILNKEPERFSSIHKHAEVEEGFITGGISVNQVHKSDVVQLSSIPDDIISADGIITDKKEMMLTIRVADCAPVYMLDIVNKAIALLHCGWRPIAAGILENAVELLRKKFDSNPRDLVCFIGPCIGKEDYEVGEELMSYFQKESFTHINDALHFDIPNEITTRLVKLGLSRDKIESFPISTFSDKSFCSYRRDGDKAGRMIAYLEII